MQATLAKNAEAVELFLYLSLIETSFALLMLCKFFHCTTWREIIFDSV